jgi:hypothetical protein
MEIAVTCEVPGCWRAVLLLGVRLQNSTANRVKGVSLCCSLGYQNVGQIGFLFVAVLEVELRIQ